MRPQLSPPENNLPLYDGSNLDVDWAAWLVPEILEDEQYIAHDSDSTLTDLLSTPPLPTHLDQDSFNEGDSEASKTWSNLTLAGDPIIPHSPLTVEAHGSVNERSETVTTATINTKDIAITDMTPISEDVGYMNLPKVMSMQEFIKFQMDGTREYSADKRRLNLDAVYAISQNVQHLGDWPPDAPYHQFQGSEFSETFTTHQESHDPSRHIFAQGEQAQSGKHQPYSFRDQSPASFKNSQAVLNSGSGVEHWLNESSDIEISQPFDRNSPIHPKHSRAMADSHQLDSTMPEQGAGLDKQMRLLVPSSGSLPIPQTVPSMAPDKGTESLSRNDFSEMCKSYVSEHYHLPSDEKAVILPHQSQPSKQVTEWLDNKIDKRKETKANEGFDSPNVLQDDPLEDLTPQNEEHEAARCLRAAELIFDQDVTGQSDWYDHGMEGAYHFIPKEETDKWNDDSNWFITDQEFNHLIDEMYPDPKESAKLPQTNNNRATDDAIMKDASTSSSTSGKEKELKETKSTGEGAEGKNQLELEPSFRPCTPLIEKEGAHKQIHKDQQLEKPDSEPLTAEGAMRGQILDPLIQQTRGSMVQEARIKNVHSLTPPRGPKTKVARLDTTPQHSPAVVEPFDSAKTLDSCKIVVGGSQAAGTDTDNQSTPAPSFHTDEPTTPTRKLSSVSKGRKAAYDSQEKTTKNVFAAVDSRGEQPEKSAFSSNPSAIVGWGDTSHGLQQLQPSPHKGHSSGALLGTPLNEFGRASSSFSASPPQPAQSSNPLSIKPKIGPETGTFFPITDLRNQQTQEFGGNNNCSSTIGNYHLDAWGNRAGYREQLGHFQHNSNRGKGKFANPIANNHTEYPMAHQRGYTAHSDLQLNQIFPGNQSDNNTIAAASRFNEPPRRSTQSWQSMPYGNSSFHSTQLKRIAPAHQGKTVEPFDPRALRSFDTTPIKFNLPPSTPKASPREKVVINCRGHKECAKVQEMLEKAAKDVPAKRIMFTETFEYRPTKTILSAPAGNNLRGWVMRLLPHAQVDASMY